MNAMNETSTDAAQNLYVDSLDADIAESLADPEYRAAFEDSNHRYEVLDALVALRHDRGLTQKQVADRMGVGQSTIAGLENEGSDPRLSTVQRYARAVDARCIVNVQVSVRGEWAPVAAWQPAPALAVAVTVSTETPDAVFAESAANAKRSSFALAA